MSYYQPSIRPPTPEDVRRYASRHDMELTDEEANDFADLIGSKLGVLEQLEALPVEEPSIDPDYSTREMGYRPDRSEDPHNAFVRRCLVEGGDSGPLDGYDIGLKDNIAVAGVELTAGSKAFEGYVPSFDATVVARLLAAGADITGKTNLDEMAVSGSGEPTATGPILNPHSDQHLAGGSSGGSAVAVAEGAVDVALGTDQAGSVRTPAAWCGCVGYKPTFSLVPYTGCLPGGPTYDHVGPMARTIEDCAKTLSVLAGSDGLDHRQSAHCPDAQVSEQAETTDYTTRLDEDPSSFTVGVLKEGFNLEHTEPAVDQTVRALLDSFSSAGADVTDVSVPWHRDGVLVWLGVAWTESAALLRDNGQGQYMDGQYYPQYLRTVESALKTRIGEFAPTVRLKILLGEYLRSEYGGYYHAKAQNLRRELRAAYDEALAEFDVLAMPTTPTTAFEVEDELTRKELVARAQGKKGRTQNTMPFNMTGHPAITVPCGSDDEGLPVGLMLVGERFDDATVLAAASAFERSVTG
jgi:amidase